MRDVVAAVAAVASTGHASLPFFEAVKRRLLARMLDALELTALCHALSPLTPAAPESALARSDIVAEIIAPQLTALFAHPGNSMGPLCTAVAAAKRAGFASAALRNVLASALVGEGDGVGLLALLSCAELGVTARALEPPREHAAAFAALAAEATKRFAGKEDGLSPPITEVVAMATEFAAARVVDGHTWDAIEAAASHAAPRLSGQHAALFAVALWRARGAHGAALGNMVAVAGASVHTLQCEAALELLAMWPRLPSQIRSRQPNLPETLAGAIVAKLTPEAWRAPPDLLAFALKWAAAAKQASADCGIDRVAEANYARTSSSLSRALLPSLPRTVSALPTRDAAELLAAVALSTDASVWHGGRAQFKGSEAAAVAARGVVCALLADLASQAGSGGSSDDGAAVLRNCVFALGALGVDAPAIVLWLGKRIADMPQPEEAATLCWVCAELRVHRAAARELARRTAEAVLREPGVGQPRGLSLEGALRLAWALLALDCAAASSGASTFAWGGSAPPGAGQPEMSEAALAVALASRALRAMLVDGLPKDVAFCSAAEARTLRQLALHLAVSDDAYARTWAVAYLQKVSTRSCEPPRVLEAVRLVRAALSELGIPTSARSSETAKGVTIESVIATVEPPGPLCADSYGSVAAVLQLQSLVVDVTEALTDNTMGAGTLGGAALLRRRQLEAQSWQVCSLSAETLPFAARSPSRPNSRAVIGDAASAGVAPVVAAALLAARPAAFAALATLAAAASEPPRAATEASEASGRSAARQERSSQGVPSMLPKETPRPGKKEQPHLGMPSADAAWRQRPRWRPPKRPHKGKRKSPSS